MKDYKKINWNQQDIEQKLKVRETLQQTLTELDKNIERQNSQNKVMKDSDS